METPTSDYFTFPYLNYRELPAFRKSDFKEFKTISISKNIYTNQPTVQNSVIQTKRKGKNLTLPYVVEFKGDLLLVDGHHTIVAKKLNGQKKVRAMFLKLD